MKAVSARVTAGLNLGAKIIASDNSGAKIVKVVSVKRAKAKCEAYAEKQAFISRNPAGSIFLLKNYGWTDRQDINVNASIQPIGVDLSLLSDEELQTLKALQHKAKLDFNKPVSTPALPAAPGDVIDS